MTPGFPAYVSGHASVSAAAAEVLSIRLPDAGQDWPTHAEEAAMSRLYGGIHYPMANENGLAQGACVAGHILGLKTRA